MSATLLCLVALSASVSPAPKAAVGIDARARATFAACYQEVLKDVKDCPAGECGRYLGGCYARELEVIEADTRNRILRLQGWCHGEADTLEAIQGELKAALESKRTFQERWSGMELRVEAALLRNRVLKVLEEECRK